MKRKTTPYRVELSMIECQAQSDFREYLFL